MNKYKPIRLFRCPQCDKLLVRRTKATTLDSYCVTPKHDYRDVKLKAYGKQSKIN